MSATSTPYGLRPVKMIGSQPFAGAMIEVPMTTNSATAIFSGDTVAINTGTAVAGAVTPTTTRSTSTPVGICVGVRYTDPVNKQELHNTYLPANAITNGYTNVFIKVVDDPDAIFQIQADGAVAATNLGTNGQLGNFGAGSTTTGNSKIQLVSGTLATTATFAVRIVGFATAPGSVAGDAYTDVLVKFNQGVHAYLNATGG